MHVALRRFFDVRQVPLSERRPERIGELLRNAWSRLPKGVSRDGVWSRTDRVQLFGSLEQERSCGLQAISALENYLLQTNLSVVPLALETWLDFPVNGVTLAGRIDRIDQEGERGVAVWDYKTGKLPYYKTAQEIIDAGDYQLPLYALLAGRRFPHADVVRAGLIYVRFNEVYQLNWTRNELTGITEEVLGFVGKMKAEQEFAPTVNALCPWCEYREGCPGMQKGFDEVLW
jgi:hypothetical protein